MDKAALRKAGEEKTGISLSGFQGGLFLPEKERNMRDKSKGNPRALLPIGVFLVIFLGAGILSGDFYTMPAIVGFLIALTVAFCQNRRLRFADKLTVISKGIG